MNLGRPQSALHSHQDPAADPSSWDATILWMELDIRQGQMDFATCLHQQAYQTASPQLARAYFLWPMPRHPEKVRRRKRKHHRDYSSVMLQLFPDVLRFPYSWGKLQKTCGQPPNKNQPLPESGARHSEKSSQAGAPNSSLPSSNWCNLDLARRKKNYGGRPPTRA